MKKSHTPFDKRNGRIIVINGIKWKYKVGTNYVIAYSENGTRKCEKAWIIKGTDSYTWERGQRKGSGDGAMTPKDIETWLYYEK